MTYQKITGTLKANSHPGSYCGQDAHTDMFVTEKKDVVHRKRTTASSPHDQNGWGAELYARCPNDFEGGGVKIWILRYAD